ncbi:unnamed protein product [Plutella xylostella]|uniref:(diamondback moth) hypothetical protein n=1 Tax=Plutella xylostella TaxID=51655 RepID=A0A8S4GE02_PLUXY|nr:unnamed protein product [Plutella xylostella]
MCSYGCSYRGGGAGDCERERERGGCGGRGGSTQRVGLDPAQSVLGTDRFAEADVRELVALGFTREQAITELRRFNGDKTQATAALFAKSLKF